MSQQNQRRHLAAASVLAGLIMLPALSPRVARADGAFFAPPPYYIWEYEQIAYLDWNAASSTETLAILPGFHGNADEFAWVVPVPTVPTVQAGSRDLFDELNRLTAPQYRYRDGSWSCEDSHIVYDVAQPAGGVNVIDRDLVGIYDVLVLAADEAVSLADTLTAWGFLHEGNQGDVTPLLDDYIARDWVFVAMRVDSTAYHDIYPYGDNYVYGGLDPIELSFTIDAPVYPMRLSAASAEASTKVLLFAVSDHRLDFAGATTNYANRFGASEYQALVRAYPAVASRLSADRFLTRLERYLGPADMGHDLALVRARDDTEFASIHYSGVPFFGVFLGLWATTWTLGKARRRWRGAARL